MIVTACAIGVGAGVGGLYLSYYAGIAAGAAIAGLLVCAAVAAEGLGRAVRRGPDGGSTPKTGSRTS